MGDRIDELIAEVIVDAYGDDEQLWSFRQAFEDDARFPFAGQVVGVDVEVLEVDYDGDEGRGLVAVCRRAGGNYTVSLLDLSPAGPLTLETRELLDAYRRWSAAEPLPGVVPVTTEPWVYPRLAVGDVGFGPPLALVAMGDWDPADEYWGEPGDPVPPLWQQVIVAGVRPCFEMEQVLPGADDDDWDCDPIVDAAELHRAGYRREAIRLLEGLLAQDRRCVDAWGHLGNFMFHSRGPGPALDFYMTGVAVAEQALPIGFAGVLSRGMSTIDRSFAACTAWDCARGANGDGTMPRRSSPPSCGSTRPARSTRSPASNR